MSFGINCRPNEPVEEVSILEVYDEDDEEDIFLDGDGIDELDETIEVYLRMLLMS